jgi:hypothetical protein
MRSPVFLEHCLASPAGGEWVAAAFDSTTIEETPIDTVRQVMLAYPLTPPGSDAYAHEVLR